ASVGPEGEPAARQGVSALPGTRSSAEAVNSAAAPQPLEQLRKAREKFELRGYLVAFALATFLFFAPIYGAVRLFPQLSSLWRAALTLAWPIAVATVYATFIYVTLEDPSRSLPIEWPRFNTLMPLVADTLAAGMLAALLASVVLLGCVVAIAQVRAEANRLFPEGVLMRGLLI